VISGSTRNSDKPEMSSRTTEGQRIEVSAMDNLKVRELRYQRWTISMSVILMSIE
jgi:hypothetical protein